MFNFNSIDLIDLVEEYASNNGLVSSEAELSELFDSEVMPILIEAHGKKGEEFNDQPMIDENFNNWTDGLRDEGAIHEEQYNTYTYIGKWS